MAILTQTDVENRLTAAGVLWYMDQSGDGSLSTAEQAQLNDAIAYADETVEGYRPATDTLNRSAAWIKHQAVDIAAYRVATHYGQQSLEALRLWYETAIENLEAWSAGRASSDESGEDAATTTRAFEVVNVRAVIR